MRRKFQEQLAEKDNQVKDLVRQGVAEQRPQIATEESTLAKQRVADEIAKLNRQIDSSNALIDEQSKKLEEAHRTALLLEQTKRAFDDEKRALELATEQRVTDLTRDINKNALASATERISLDLREKDLRIQGLSKTINELQQKAMQGSQQTQGEAQERALEEILESSFPTDKIEAVGKGERGGDIVQNVIGPRGQLCGKILWESKRTKTWGSDWIGKLRGDQRESHCDMSVLVTRALPKDVTTFDFIEEVWVTNWALVVPVATMVRHALIEVSLARNASANAKEKAEMLYDYLVGSVFRRRFQAVVDAFSMMNEDLDKERKAMQRMWARREKQLTIVSESTTALAGDLEGISGSSIPALSNKGARALPSFNDDTLFADADFELEEHE